MVNFNNPSFCAVFVLLYHFVLFLCPDAVLADAIMGLNNTTNFCVALIGIRQKYKINLTNIIRISYVVLDFNFLITE